MVKAALVTVNCTLAAAAVAGETAVFFKPSKSAAEFPLRERSAFFPSRILFFFFFLTAEPQIDHLDSVVLFLAARTPGNVRRREHRRFFFQRMPFSRWQPISIAVWGFSVVRWSQIHQRVVANGAVRSAHTDFNLMR